MATWRQVQGLPGLELATKFWRMWAASKLKNYCVFVMACSQHWVGWGACGPALGPWWAALAGAAPSAGPACPGILNRAPHCNNHGPADPLHWWSVASWRLLSLMKCHERGSATHCYLYHVIADVVPCVTVRGVCLA